MPDLSKIVRLLNGKDRNVKLYPDTLARRVFRSNGQNVDVALHNLEETSVSKDYVSENYYDKVFMNGKDVLVVKDDGEDVCVVEERDISYNNIPLYCGKWVDGKDIHRRVYVVTSGIAKGNIIKVADKPVNMVLLIEAYGIVEGTASATKHTMTNSDITVYVNDDGVYAVNNFTGYAERLYIVLEYTVTGGSV